MRNRIKIWFAALAVTVAAGITVLPTPAYASFLSCPYDRTCIFDGADGTGSYYYWGPEFANSCVNIGAPFNDIMSSAMNNYSPHPGHNWQVLFYRDANCLGGTVACISFWRCYLVPGETVNANGGSNNVASSFRVRPNV